MTPLRPRRLLRTALGLVLGAALAATITACEPAPAPAQVVVDGRGFGHGIGMSQWGALGYAVDDSWTSAQILDHYYGGTTAATLPGVGRQRVYLTASKDKELVVFSQAGTMTVDGFDSPVSAVRIARLSSTMFRTYRGTSCGGPWTLIGDRTAGQIAVTPSSPSTDDPAEMLQHCTTAGTRYYRGSLLAVQALSTIVTVSDVGTEQLVRSVIPKEMSPSWSDLGSGRGGQALRAQAVAARTYVLAGDPRWGSWATSCDSSQCQAYMGYGSRASGSTSIVKVEDPRADAAVAATARVIRRLPSGRPALTQFGASSGGWTAGGGFPAVVDEGDDYRSNPNHTWALTLTRAAIESAFDARQGTDVGTLAGLDVLTRNGMGADGGRVLTMRARFTRATVSLTGDQFRLLFGLKSNWFRLS